MDGRLLAVLVVLNVFVQLAAFVDREDVTEARVLVKWVPIDAVWCLFGRQDEDRPRSSIGALCPGCRCISLEVYS